MDQDALRWRRWAEALLKGDDVVVAEFWQQYGPRLGGLAAKRLSPGLQSRVDPDDIVQSTCRTFFRRAQNGEFHLADSESLWKLLCVLAITKVRQHARYHSQQKRSTARERAWDDTPAAAAHGQGRGPDTRSAEYDVEFAEELQHVIEQLDAEEQQLVELKLAQLTNRDIGQQMGCSERTVRRLFKRVQSKLQRLWNDLDEL